MSESLQFQGNHYLLNTKISERNADMLFFVQQFDDVTATESIRRAVSIYARLVSSDALLEFTSDTHVERVAPSDSLNPTVEEELPITLKVNINVETAEAIGEALLKLSFDTHQYTNDALRIYSAVQHARMMSATVFIVRPEGLAEVLSV